MLDKWLADEMRPRSHRHRARAASTAERPGAAPGINKRAAAQIVAAVDQASVARIAVAPGPHCRRGSLTGASDVRRDHAAAAVRSK